MKTIGISREEAEVGSTIDGGNIFVCRIFESYEECEVGPGIYIEGLSTPVESIAVPATIAGLPVVSVRIAGNGLRRIDTSAADRLVQFDAHGNELSELDLSSNSKLAFVDASDNQLTSLALPRDGKLECVCVAGNRLHEIDLANNLRIWELILSRNPLAAAPDLKQFSNLHKLDLSRCGLQSYPALNSDAPLSLVWVSGNPFSREGGNPWDLSGFDMEMLEIDPEIPVTLRSCKFMMMPLVSHCERSWWW